MNEKAGMNEVELQKYIEKCIIPLYPDLCDQDGKRVIIRCDTGPGRMNVKMLANLRALGVYVVPGVPNTTHVTQETDRNYGLFKSVYRENLCILSEFRFKHNKPLSVVDFPLLVFGIQHDDILLDDAFASSFSKQKNLESWKAIGTAPFTRACLTSDAVRHEIVYKKNGDIDMDADPKTATLLALEAHNQLCCDILTAEGCDGSTLCVSAPMVVRESQSVSVTVPLSCAMQDQIQKAHTAGKMFVATKGTFMNNDDFFIADTWSELEKKIAEVDAKKKQVLELMELETCARTILNNFSEKQVPMDRCTVSNLKVLVRWKMGGKQSKKTQKEQLLQQYKDLPEPLLVV